MRNQALTRRNLIGAALAAATPVFAQPRAPARITMLGDSLTAGYGLRASEAVPARLEAELIRLGTPVKITAAGVSGDTSAAGLRRVDFSVRPDTQLCIVALGGNDLLQGLDYRQMEANLTAIVKKLQARKIAVVLAGIGAPEVLGAAYARDFNAVYARIGKTLRIPVYPDMLAGVAGQSAMMQRDGVHPNARGADVVAKRLAPVIASALKARR